MAGTYVTTPRPYSKINIAVQNCRELASLGSSIDFSITEFIVGPLIDHFRGRLGIEYILQDEVAGPAEVVINGDKTSILLRVSKKIWAAASRGEAEGRRILAHEIGHIWLHRDDKFRFSDDIEFNHRFIPSECFVENQANVFADIFLLPDQAVRNFDAIQELIDYCDYYSGVPGDVIQRRFCIAQERKRHYFLPKYEIGRICAKCGEEKVSLIVSVLKCDNCGNVSYQQK